MTTRLIIARHGNTFGLGDIVTRVGKTDLPLVESGLQQGQLLGRYLKQAVMVPDVIYTSRLKRTQETARQAQTQMGTALPLQPLSIFDEIDYGPDENKPEAAVVARLGEAALKAWDSHAQVPDGWVVDPVAIIANWKTFADGILRDHAGKTVLVVTSNGTARFAPHLTGNFAGFAAQHDIKLSTGAFCLFEHDGASWRCVSWNQKPKDLLSL